MCINRFWKIRAACLLFIIILCVPVLAEDQNTITLENEYIKVFINNTGDGKGRFAIDVKEGDPARDSDNGKPLIYGHPIPWTSFTTIRINKRNYLFGGPTTRRAGKNTQTAGLVQGPLLSGDSLVMTCWFGAVEVRQDLSIAKGPSTGLPDTLKIKYTIHNEGGENVIFGARIVIDALLGANDGAPFRFFGNAITSDTILAGEEMPDYWQAFDSLLDPQVVAQGTLKGGEITTPSRMVFSNWGKLSDNLWDVTLDNRADFTREGEFDLDSAVALFYDDESLAPGAVKTIIAYYGLGALSVNPGMLFLGVSAPAEVAVNRENSGFFTITGYLMNTASAAARNVAIKLQCPPALKITGEKLYSLGDLMPGEIRQVSWQVQAHQKTDGMASFEVQASAGNAAINTISREINVVSPPCFEVTCRIPGDDRDFSRDFFPATVVITNKGGSAAHEIHARVSGYSGVSLARFEKPEKYLDILEKGEKTSLHWFLNAAENADGRISFQLTVTSLTADTISMTSAFLLPRLQPAVFFTYDGLPRQQGRLVTVEIKGRQLPQLGEISMEIAYNPYILKFVKVSRGSFFIENNGLGQWEKPIIKKDLGIISIKGRRSSGHGQDQCFATLVFLAVNPGTAKLAVIKSSIRLSGGKEIDLPVEEQLIEIKN
ncbi:MAG: hypothetical protein ACM3WV_06680 [Bacillota bacterium]